MKILLIILSAVLILSAKVDAASTPLSVVIVGGGPAGLATAIEAHNQGASVTVIEKRASYAREQTLFLFDSSLCLLEKWDVHLPQMKQIELPDDSRMGIVKINHLEQSLENRVAELKIKKIFGEFLGFQEGTRTIFISSNGGVFSLPYDLLVGADGVHSTVRAKCGIECQQMGQAESITTFTPFAESDGEFDISDTIKVQDVFMRKVSLPSTSIIFTQRAPGSADMQETISEQTLEERLKECKWQREAKIVAEGKAKISPNITVFLQQASTFSDERRSVILIGDAAAVGSYLQGMGANTAFKSASIAGRFFKNFQQNERDAYSYFNEQMQKTTDALINDSKYLFSP